MKVLALAAGILAVIAWLCGCTETGGYDPVAGERIGRALGAAYSNYYAPPAQPVAPVYTVRPY